MKELHSVIDQDGFGLISDENNQYYQPTIKTTRKERYPKRIFCENYEYIPKQPLIKFLKDKIKHLENVINKSNIKPYGEELHLLENSLSRYEEVLDFVGGNGETKQIIR